MGCELFRWREISPNIYQISNHFDERAYCVVGDASALVVDTCSGYGDIFEVIDEICLDVPFEVALTHSHYDHVGGTFGLERVYMAELEDGKWEDERRRGLEAAGKLRRQDRLVADIELMCQSEPKPKVTHIAEGHLFDLGGLTVEAVSLPGHTAGSLGFLVRERRVLLSGDAVTPVMLLCFADSLPIEAYRATLQKMRGLAFDRFYTGHHEEGFSKDTLDGFDECAAYALEHQGIPWAHSLVEEYQGTIYLPPCETSDVDSPDFRALIGPYVPRVRKRGARRARKRAQQ